VLLLHGSMIVGWCAQQAGFVAAGDGVGERPGPQEDLRTAPGHEAEHGQLVLGEQHWDHVRIGWSTCRCSVSTPMLAAWSLMVSSSATKRRRR